MNKVARALLDKLFERAENAAARETSARAVSLTTSPKTFPAYDKIHTAELRGECNADLMLAERQGCIAIDWERRAGDRKYVERVRLVDAEKLAEFLGRYPRWRTVADSREAFLPLLPRYPMLEEVLQGWSKGSGVKGTQPGDIQAWQDAIDIVDYCRKNLADGMADKDLSVRRVSSLLTGNSKRAESLYLVIDAVAMGTTELPARSMEEIFNEIGLVRYPPTFLIAGSLKVNYSNALLPVLRPYLGLAPTGIAGFAETEGIQALLSIENLTTFHDMVARMPEDSSYAVVYTGGMPSPSWCQVYTHLLRDLPPNSPNYHWGDIDGGGFRIAHHLAELCSKHGRALALHNMVVTAGNSLVSPGELDAGSLKQMLDICTRHGWQPEADGIQRYKLAIEQESLGLTWPA